MPGFQTKPLTITIVSGNDSRIIPRNVMACFTHVLSQSWFWANRFRNSSLMFLQTCAKLTFCLTQIDFLAAWYNRLYRMCLPIGRNAILGFRKNISQRPKGFQGNLDTTIIKNSPDWFRNSWMYGTIADVGTYFCETEGSRSDRSENTCCIQNETNWVKQNVSFAHVWTNIKGLFPNLTA